MLLSRATTVRCRNEASTQDTSSKKPNFKKWETKVDLIEEIYGSDTTNMISGTAWGAFNALTERLDWFRKGRGERGEENVLAAASGFDPVTNAEKGKILAAVKSVAGVK